jgi:hypothetical protein
MEQIELRKQAEEKWRQQSSAQEEQPKNRCKIDESEDAGDQSRIEFEPARLYEEVRDNADDLW